MPRMSEDEFKKLLSEKFNNKIKLVGKYKTFSCDKTIFYCEDHGEFIKTPQRVLFTQYGCPKCGKEAMGRSQSLGLKKFIEISNKTHNNKYDYSKFKYTTNKEKSIIICPEHGEFLQAPLKHMYGQGCPKCKTERTHTKEVLEKQAATKRKNGTFNASKIEDKVYTYLLNIFSKDDIERNYKSNKYPFNCDFYIRSKDLYIECNFHWTHGFHWFDETNPNDIDKLNIWKEKSKKSKFYENAINTWTVRDIDKKNTFEKNNLNYIILWSENDIDILTNI